MNIWTKEKKPTDIAITRPQDIPPTKDHISPYQRMVEEGLAISMQSYAAYRKLQSDHAEDIRTSVTDHFLKPFRTYHDDGIAEGDVYPAVVHIDKHDLKMLCLSLAEFLLGLEAILKAIQHALKIVITYYEKNNHNDPILIIEISLKESLP